MAEDKKAGRFQVLPGGASDQSSSNQGQHEEKAEPYKIESVTHDFSHKNWLIKGLFAKGECSRLVAPPKKMKSSLLGSAVNHMAAGQNWRGLKVKRTIGCLYFALERADLTIKRLSAEQQLLHWDGLPIKVCRQPIALATAQDELRMIATIERAKDELKCDVEHLSIDTSAKLMGNSGADEQQASDHAAIWSRLATVRDRTGVHTTVIGHFGKNASLGERGSNASLGDADVVTAITEKDGIKRLEISEANDLDTGELFTFFGTKYSFGFDEDGDESYVYIADPAFEGSIKNPTPDKKIELTADGKTFFTLLVDAGADGLSLTEWNEQAKIVGITKRQRLHDYKRYLLKNGFIREYNGRFKVNQR